MCGLPRSLHSLIMTFVVTIFYTIFFNLPLVTYKQKDYLKFHWQFKIIMLIYIIEVVFFINKQSKKMKGKIGSVSGANITRPEKRFLGFVIDYGIITFLRFLVFKICMSMFLTSHINTFIRETMRSAGKSFLRSKILKEQASLTIDTSLFVEIAIVAIIIILVAPAYNLLTIKFKKLKTTIGKKIFAIHPQTLDGQDVGILRILCHYFVSTLPIIPIALLISINVFNDVFANIMRGNKALSKALQLKAINIQIPTICIVLSVITVLVWYGLVLFTKKRLTVHDLICRVCFVSNGSGARPFNVPFVNEFLGKIFGKLNSIKDKILKK